MNQGFNHLSLALMLSGTLQLASADVQATGIADFEGIRIEVRGSGRPVLMIPGLNSAASVWDETCDALIPAKVQCHIVQLPGFAGHPAKGDEVFLQTQRDRLLRYVASAKLEQPIAMGHSLGGVLSLMMARAEPKTFSQLVIVDSLPFFLAAMNPGATVETVKPMVEGMRAGMMQADEKTYTRQAEMALTNLSNQEERMDTLKHWGKTSDRATTAQAMYEMYTTDLRAGIAEIQTPTLVLGAWAGYKVYGGTEASTRKVFSDQYAKLEGVRIELSPSGYHFLMWDDPEWLVAQVKGVL